MRRGSCISFDIPPITLTPVQTAVERQLLGENVQIDPDGWLLHSAQSANYTDRSSGQGTHKGNTKISSQIRRYYIEIGVLEYYEKAVNDYRIRQILGEGFDGKIRLVPYIFSKQGNKEERNIALLTAQEVNRSREWLYQYQLKKIDYTNKKAIAKIQNKYLYQHFQAARKRSGEWAYSMDKKWFVIR